MKDGLALMRRLKIVNSMAMMPHPKAQMHGKLRLFLRGQFLSVAILEAAM